MSNRNIITQRAREIGARKRERGIERERKRQEKRANHSGREKKRLKIRYRDNKKEI